MKTKAQVIAERPEYKTLINAVVSGLGGVESIEDVNAHGIDGGFGKFIYYRDTMAFYRRHKADILKLAQEMAESLGEDMLTMIGNFNCLSRGKYPNRKPTWTPSEIGESLWSGRGEGVDQIQNAMAWFAAEEVCRMFEE